MITIPSNLHQASIRDSRRPLMTVTAEAVAPAFTKLDGVSEVTMGVIPKRLQRVSSSQFACSAFGLDGTSIYFKKMTGVLNPSDWNSGWDTVLAAAGQFFGLHDMYCDGDDVLIIYRRSTNDLRYIESDDGGSTWGSHSTFPSLPGIAGVVDSFAIADIKNVYVHYWDDAIKAYTIYEIHRSHPGAVWNVIGPWDNGEYHLKPVDTYYTRLFANKNGSDKQVFFTGRIHDPVTDPNHRPHSSLRLGVTGWSQCRDAISKQFSGVEYELSFNGITRPINDIMFAGIHNRYVSKASVEGRSYEDDYFLGRTTDGVAFQLVPTNLKFRDNMSASERSDMFIYGCVLAEDNSTVCIPVIKPYTGINGHALIWFTDALSWFGGSPNEVDITDDIVGQVSVNRSVFAAETTSIDLNNHDGKYGNSDLVRAGSIIRVSAGYIIDDKSPESHQQRLTAEVINKSDSIGVPEISTFSLAGMLQRMTAVKSNKILAISGTNLFHADFSDPLEIEKLVSQVGTWGIDGDLLKQTALGTHAMTFCGFEPGNSYTISAFFEFSSYMPNSAMGIVLLGVTDCENSSSLILRISNHAGGFNDSSIDLISYKYVDGVETISTIWTKGSYTFSHGSRYGLMAKVSARKVSIWWSLGVGIGSWSEVELGIEHDYQSYNSPAGVGYPGLYAYCNSNDVAFYDVSVVSHDLPLSGSGAVRYLAGSYGLNTDEQIEFYDDFTSVFSPRWVQPPRNGTWIITDGKATAKRYKPHATAMRCDVNSNDVIVSCDVELRNEGQYSGIVVRSNASVEHFFTCFVVGRPTVGFGWQIRRECGDESTLLYQAENIGFQATRAQLTVLTKGPYIVMFVNGQLIASAFDDTETGGGYIGIGSRSPTDHADCQIDNFSVDAFYKPIDLLVVRPGEVPVGALTQVAVQYKNGYFYCNEDGALKWGTLNVGEDVDLDVRSITTKMTSARNVDKVATVARVDGNNVYAEVRRTDFGEELLGHRYVQIQDQGLTSASSASDRALIEIKESEKVTEESISIHGYPGLELCDIVGLARTKLGAIERSRVLTMTENISTGKFEMELPSLIGETYEPEHLRVTQVGAYVEYKK